MQTIEIPVSKRKLITSFLGCLLFVTAGIFFIYTPETFAGRTAFRTPGMVIAVGVLSILFFGLCGYFILKRFTVKTAGLILTEKGIIDNSAAFSGYTILWRDITEISSKKMFRQSFVVIKVKDPQGYINTETSAAIRKNMQLNLRAAGTPFCISANTLSMKFKDLLNLLQQRLSESRMVNHPTSSQVPPAAPPVQG